MSPVRWAKSLILALLFCGVVHAQSPVVIYENSGVYSGIFNQLSDEYGDEVIGIGSERVITQLQFEYYGDFVSQADEFARVRIYANTGPAWMGNNDYRTPAATPLWEGIIPIGSGFKTASISVPNVTVPMDRFTWTVQFFGLTMKPGDTAGLLFYGDPAIGRSFNDFWQNTATGWTPMRTPGVFKNNFAAKIYALRDAPLPPGLAVIAEDNNLRISWPSSATGYVLESKETVDSAFWKPIMTPTVPVADKFEVIVPMASESQVFRLTSLPKPPMEISLSGTSVRVRWPAATPGFTLQMRAGFTGANWANAPTPSRASGDYYEVNLPAQADIQFFRLIKL